MNDGSQSEPPKAEWVIAYNAFRDALDRLDSEGLQAVSNQLDRAYDALRVVGIAFLISLITLCFSIVYVSSEIPLLVVGQFLGLAVLSLMFGFGWCRMWTGIFRLVAHVNRLQEEANGLPESSSEPSASFNSLSRVERSLLLTGSAYLLFIILVTWWS